jgi:hypothetical protein
MPTSFPSFQSMMTVRPSGSSRSPGLSQTTPVSSWRERMADKVDVGGVVYRVVCDPRAGELVLPAKVTLQPPIGVQHLDAYELPGAPVQDGGLGLWFIFIAERSFYRSSQQRFAGQVDIDREGRRVSLGTFGRRARPRAR